MAAKEVRPWARAMMRAGSMRCSAAQRDQTRAIAAVESTRTPSMSISKPVQTILVIGWCGWVLLFESLSHLNFRNRMALLISLLIVRSGENCHYESPPFLRGEGSVFRSRRSAPLGCQQSPIKLSSRHGKEG